VDAVVRAARTMDQRCYAAESRGAPRAKRCGRGDAIMTHTYVILEVTPSTYAEIEEKLRAAGYDHVFTGAGGEKDVIDMHGIALQRSTPGSPSQRDDPHRAKRAGPGARRGPDCIDRGVR